MIELTSNQLIFRFPEVHPECVLSVTLHRTLRIPDDGREYPLPPSLGHFPAVHVDDHSARVPKKWLGRGGVAIPMWQSEAMWLQFSPQHIAGRASAWPFAVKVACGKVSAVTGKKWSKKLLVDDYLVCPLQPWLDGFVAEDGQIKQFIAAPLGLGATVEGQVTGKEEFGGLQLEVIPMIPSEFLQRFPLMPVQTHILRGLNYAVPGVYSHVYTSSGVGSSLTANWKGSSIGTLDCSMSNVSMCSTSDRPGPTGPQGPCGPSGPSGPQDYQLMNASLDMGMGMGGRMKQQVFKDPYGLTVWARDHKARVFVHMCNSLGWRHLTGKEPPTVPFTAARYTQQGFKWFHYYEEGAASQQGTKTLKKVKSVVEYAKKKKIPLVPENQPANIPASQTLVIKQKGIGKVREGSWAK